MNHMEEVAKLFGKKLNEHFKAKTRNGNYDVWFSEKGIVVRDLDCMKWEYLLSDLLTGEAEIVGDE